MEHLHNATGGAIGGGGVSQQQPQRTTIRDHSVPVAEYIEVDELNEGRLLEKTAYSVGSLYVTGVGLGMVTGVYRGLRYGQTGTFKLVMNSILNQSGKLSVRCANGLGVMALFFHGTQLFYDHFIRGSLSEEKQKTVADMLLVPGIAGGVAGGIYRLPGGPYKALFGFIPGFIAGVAYDTYEKNNADFHIKRVQAALNKAPKAE